MAVYLSFVPGLYWMNWSIDKKTIFYNVILYEIYGGVYKYSEQIKTHHS